MGSFLKVGVIPVSCTATDTATGLSVQRDVSVTVRDSKPPAITSPTSLSVSAEGAFGAHVSYTATALDLVDGSVTTTCTPPSGGVFALGDTMVSCNAVDKAGNQAFKQFRVTVTDTSRPILHLSDMTVADDSVDWTGARVIYTPAPFASNVSGNPVAIDCLPPTGTRFPLGDTVVNCTAGTGTHEARGTFVVHVVDQVPPFVIVPATIVVDATGPAGAAVPFTAIARDLVDGEIVPVCRRTTGFGLPTPVMSGGVFPVGDSLVTCTATDEVGNVGSNAFAVIVRDRTPPVLTLPPNITVVADKTDTAVVSFAATAVDGLTGSLPVACTPPSGSRFLLGTTTVSCVARDAAGNEARGTFSVTVVRDTTGPILTVPPDITISTCTSASVNIGTATATDANSPPVTITNNKPATFPLGTTTVTWTATDARGNKTTGTQRVTAVLGTDQSCCPSGTTIIKGTSNNVGGSGQDNITGGLGADVIDGDDGDDTIRGGDGNDTLHGGVGQDKLYGENNDDQLFGDDGNDTLDGAAGNDTLNGGVGTDTCTGGTGTNTITQCP